MDWITLRHDHPLVLDEWHQVRMGYICYMCKQPVCGPLIFCEEKRDFFVHKTCAELPKEIQHPSHSQHHLFLHMSPPHKEGVNVVYCDGCGEKCEGSVYHCSNCNFNLDLICAFEERKIVHSSHKHPLFLVHKNMVFNCDACFREKSDSCYLCVTCQYSIHKRCAKLPGTITVAEHGHPLSLVYSLRDLLIGFFYFYCDICEKDVGRDIWSYFCYKCKFVAHLDCAISAAELSRLAPLIQLMKATAFKDSPLLRLPVTTDLDLIKYFVTKNKHQPTLLACRDPGHAYLYLHSEPPPVKLTCDVCTLHISSSSFYCCTPHANEIPRMRSSCNYFLHEVCSRLPVEIGHPFHPQHSLTLRQKVFFYDVYICDGCNRQTNGSVYRCRSCNFSLDVKCASLPSTILHHAHKHPLALGSTRPHFRCRACFQHRHDPGFRFACETCKKYFVSFQCVRWSWVASHRWDEHRLPLICNTKIEDAQDFICEVCEKDIHPQEWFYHCTQCENSFHPRCMPQYDKHSNIKFGGVLRHEKHPHPLAFRRRSKIRHVFKCKCCHKKIEGGPLFECTEGCDFGICHPCILDDLSKYFSV